MTGKKQAKAAKTAPATSNGPQDAQDVKAVMADASAPNDKSPQGTKATASPVTPMMAQFLEIKAANPGSLLFYRMGDFYELFFEDAEKASRALGIMLTKRGKHEGNDIPMCGVPVHAADEYLQKLIRLGFRVAVCEQMENPAEAKKRGAKSVVKRDVVRLVTPGTLTEDSLLDAASSNFLTALFWRSDDNKSADTKSTERKLAFASLDISTGEFLIHQAQKIDLSGELAGLAPSEIVVPDSQIGDPSLAVIAEIIGAALTPVPGAYFSSVAGERDMKAGLGVKELAGFGTYTRDELAAVGALLKYVELTQIGKKPVLRAPKQAGNENALIIDAATRTNLELNRTTSGDKNGSLLSAIDRTVTGPGGRALASAMARPLTDPVEIGSRLDAVGFFLADGMLRLELRKTLRSTPDIARGISRLAFGRGSPRDLGAVRDGLNSAIDLAASAATHKNSTSSGGPDGQRDTNDQGSALIAHFFQTLGNSDTPLLKKLEEALADELPALRRDGGFVREGYNGDLDMSRRLAHESRKVIAELQSTYQENTGVKSLKVRHNNLLGYFVEVTALNAQSLTKEPHSDIFIHRQSLANSVRFTTTELSEIEQKIVTAADRALALEDEIFAELEAAVLAGEEQLSEVAGALAELDLYCSLAELAEAENYTRPILDNSKIFDIRGGRHPVVEQAQKKLHEGEFIENDCVLGHATGHDTKRVQSNTKKANGSDDLSFDQSDSNAASNLYPSGFDEHRAANIWLLTGPNMAGKSTFLRQNALIAILAQMGSYVPARFAHIGVLDRLFSRVGASDDLARGRSTFMVEMIETAAILNQASDRSFVILDEIGRGTATFDGLSIAWATVEYLHEKSKCRALFATHYHELTALTSSLGGLANATVEVKEWQGEIIFMHKVVPGAADKSYGIQVAKLAGLPGEVISRASQVLSLLEESDRKIATETIIDDLPLFAALRPEAPRSADPSPSASKLQIELSAINPDELSPKEALDILFRLKSITLDE